MCSAGGTRAGRGTTRPECSCGFGPEYAGAGSSSSRQRAWGGFPSSTLCWLWHNQLGADYESWMWMDVDSVAPALQQPVDVAPNGTGVCFSAEPWGFVGGLPTQLLMPCAEDGGAEAEAEAEAVWCAAGLGML
jgi:hypothetical protein